MIRTPTARARAAGFTLLETIVTLVVVSMIVVVLMQALRHSLSLRERLLRHEQAARMDALQEQWFRDTVSAAVADLPDALGPMRGGPDAFELVTAAPLSGSGPVRVGWSLRSAPGGTSLVYEDPRWDALEVLPGPLQEARFEYMDAGGTWQAEWEQPEPPDATGAFDGDDTAPVAEPDALPRMVRLLARTQTSTLVWMVPVPAYRQPRTMLRLEASGDGI